jgi:hypothetical protein
MSLLSELFQMMRESIVIIQRFCRMFLAKRRCFNEKQATYVTPWEKQFSVLKETEESNLFDGKKLKVDQILLRERDN